MHSAKEPARFERRSDDSRAKSRRDFQDRGPIGAGGDLRGARGPRCDSAKMKVSRFRGRFISAVYVGLGFNTASVGEEQDFLLPNVNGHR